MDSAGAALIFDMSLINQVFPYGKYNWKLTPIKILGKFAALQYA